jgi:hypothetical protein
VDRAGPRIARALGVAFIPKQFQNSGLNLWPGPTTCSGVMRGRRELICSRRTRRSCPITLQISTPMLSFLGWTTQVAAA